MLRGHALVTLPSLGLFIGPFFVVDRLVPNPSFFVVLATFLANLAAAWLWWAWTIPKWRLWAYERVDDIDMLIRRSYDDLQWPQGKSVV